MAIKKVFLHIGQQKTGTTSLQKFFALNRKKLGQNNYLYPESLGGEKHPFLFKKIDELNDLDSDVYSKFINEINRSGCTNLILSEENLFTLRDELLINLAHFLNIHFNDITIIVYLRRQFDQAPSLYQEVVKGKVFHKYEKWLGKKLQKKYYDYHYVLGRWKSALPFSKLVVRPFHNFVENDIRLDILSILDYKNTSSLNFDDRNNFKNNSIDSLSIELLRVTNAYIKANNSLDPEKLKKRMREYVASKPFGHKLELSFEQKKALWETCKESNEKLVSEYNITDSSYFLDPPKKLHSQYNTKHEAEMLIYELSRIFELI